MPGSASRVTVATLVADLARRAADRAIEDRNHDQLIAPSVIALAAMAALVTGGGGAGRRC